MDTAATAAETTTTTTTSAAAATPIATTEGNTENTNGARTVRSNWLIYSWNRISRAHKAILIMSLILVIFQVMISSQKKKEVQKSNTFVGCSNSDSAGHWK